MGKENTFAIIGLRRFGHHEKLGCLKDFKTLGEPLHVET
jgi:hypothetical protein